MSLLEISEEVFTYASDFINNLPVNYPDADISVSIIYVYSIIFEIISTNGIYTIDDPDFDDNLFEKINNNINDNLNNIKDRYTEIIQSLNDKVIENINEFDDTVQYNIISDAMKELRNNDKNIYDNSGFNKYTEKIEPYVIDMIKKYNQNIEINLEE